MTSYKFTKTDFERILATLQRNLDSQWVTGQGFQKDIADMAFHKLKKRSVGWLSHWSVWKDDNESKFEKAFIKFEKKHLGAYKRWKKTTGISGNFELKSGQSLEERVVNLFLYYLVYGEIHDFRAMKNVFHLFYHCALEKYAENEKQIANWIREQGKQLYKILALMYSKEEMNMQCFHHDDLDDLCGSSWAKSSFYKDSKDFAHAFGLNDPKSSKFPNLAKLIQLDTPTFILYWMKSNQPDLNKDETKRQARDEWIKQNFLENQDDVNTVEKLTAEIQVIKDRLDNSSKSLKQHEERWKQETRPRPSVTDFNRSDVAESFHMALTQFETTKDLLASAEAREATAMNHLKDAKIKYFNLKKDATTEFKQAFKILSQLQQDYEECEKGFARTLEGFSDRSLSSDCMSYILESKFLQAKATYKKLFIVDVKLKNSISRILQFAYEDAVMQERFEFAHKWKTYFEKAGGPLGLWGYVTVFYHYAQIVYLHTLLLIPMLWLYFDYQKKIDTSDPVGSLMKLVDMATISSPKKNLILPLGFPIILCLLFFLAFNILFRWRLRGVSAPRRDAGCKSNWNTQSRLVCFFLWMLTIIVEIVVMNYMIIEPIKEATNNFTANWHYIKSPILLFVHWVPVIVLYFSSIQFVFTLWIGVFGWYFGLRDRVAVIRSWKELVARFEKRPMKGLEKVTIDKGKDKSVDLDDDLTEKDPGVPLIIDDFAKSMIPDSEDMSDQRKYVAFAKVWNSIILYFYDIHKISKEELQRYSYKIKVSDDIKPDQMDYLSGTIDKEPELKKEPICKEVYQHLLKFVNNLQMTKPTKRIAVEEMLPVCVVTPVGAEKILYPYEFITHVDNTQNSFLQHLIDRAPSEWLNFKNKECLSEKAKDWVDRMEKDILQRAGNDEMKNKRSKKWIDATPEGQELKKKICEWASLRFQALYRTVYGFMHVPKALQVLARIQNPTMSQEAAEELVRWKFNYVVGYQSLSSSYKLYKSSKERAKRGENLSKPEIEAHDVVYNIKYLKKKFPDLKIAYPDSNNGKHYGRLVCGNSKLDKQNCRDYSFELFGPFSDMGLGKPVHQNFLSHFVDGMIVQTIDVNQDSVISQSFFVPNVCAEFDQSPVKIVGCPEFVITAGWSSTAWCSAFVERTFGTISHRSYSRMGIRLHYGHPDYIDAMWVMCETGLSKLSYVSEDIFTGFDTVLKGGRIIHVEYHEVGKARDVDLYTTTKFTRKISMGASQMACSRYINQLQTSSSVSYFQALSYYYSTTGFYVNHLILYLSVWFALASQLVLIILQRFFFSDEISGLITTRIFTFQIGLALVTPGVFQLILERGLIGGFWAYFSHFFILAVYSTFHILNFASYWQWGLVNSAFYLGSGRGTGLEHYFMKDMYENFYKTHWRAGFLIFWMGVLALIISADILVFCVMYLLPSAIWLWGAMFLNPGSLPSTVHEEQWKRLMNRDMNETREIVKQHAKIHEYHPATKGNVVKRFLIGIGRSIKYLFRLLHWIYTVVNFAIQMRVLRFIALMSMVWEFIFSEKIPTFIFTDERRRVIRWDEESTRNKSIFFSTLPKKNNMLRTNSNSSNNKLKRPPIPFATNNNQDNQSQPAISSDSRPLPTPPNANRDLLKKAQFARSKNSHNFVE